MPEITSFGDLHDAIFGQLNPDALAELTAKIDILTEEVAQLKAKIDD